MKTFLCLLVVALQPVCSSADPLRMPGRVVKSARVDLTPLFAWWANPAGERPMKSWVRITGPVEKYVDGFWQVDAQVEIAPGKVHHQKVLLRNPPKREKEIFEQIHALRVQAAQARGKYQAGLASAKESDATTKTALGLSGATSSRLLGNAFDSAAMNSQERAAEKEIAAHDQNANAQKLDAEANRLAAANAALKIPDGEIYTLDYFAISASEFHCGMAVLDVGLLQ